MSCSCPYADVNRLRFVDKDPVTFIRSAYPNQKEVNWENNQLWELNDKDYNTRVSTDVATTVLPNGEIVTETSSTCLVTLSVQRVSEGILLRLGLPICVLMTLSGFVFWAAAEKRIAATMSILLAVSTLYIVAFGNIPMLGYLTSFDSYIITMFFLLTVAVSMHQFIFRVNDKSDRRPLRYVVIRSLEFIGRLVVFPTAVLLFLDIFFSSNVLDGFRTAIITVLVITVTFIFFRDLGGVKKTLLRTMAYFEERRSRKELRFLSYFELTTFYYYDTYLKRFCETCKLPKMSRGDEEEEEEDGDMMIPRISNPNFSKHTSYVSQKRQSVPMNMQVIGDKAIDPKRPYGKDSMVVNGSQGKKFKKRAKKQALIDRLHASAAHVAASKSPLPTYSSSATAMFETPLTPVTSELMKEREIDGETDAGN